MKNTDILVIGGGIIGLCLAIELKKSLPDTKITLLEKEKSLGYHASGRNSGVLHAGFYYTNDSLKARFCRDGNKIMSDYCVENKLPINRCGKLVVTTTEDETEQLNILYERGVKNRVELNLVDEQQLQEIEPNACTINQALYSPTTSTVNPTAVMKQLEVDAKRLGITIQTHTRYLSSNHNIAKTNRDLIEYDYLVNTAGLYADKIARQFEFCQQYKIIPFKGLYLYSDTFSLNTNIYPVPNIEQPFLGTHFTVSYDGKVKIGPTAAPAFWREQYGIMNRFSIQESFETGFELSHLWLSDSFQFRQLAKQELSKLNKKTLAESAGKMLKHFNWREFNRWAKPGIRAQLINTQTRELEMDFKYEGDDQTFHVLNAVSPAFTCAFPFAKYLSDKILKKIE